SLIAELKDSLSKESEQLTEIHIKKENLSIYNENEKEKSDLRELLNEAIKNNEKLKNSYETELKKTVEEFESIISCNQENFSKNVEKYKSEFEQNMVVLNSEFEIKIDNHIKMQSSSDSEILKLRKQISDLKSINKTKKTKFFVI
ncbi:hypothetical protein BpHYR1_047858, partial [Brachionus plicatilis]